MYPGVGEKRRIDDINIEDEEAIGSCRASSRSVSPKSAMEQEKRIRRQIANSNERRRMESINKGFSSLKSLLPHHEGEKLSKAAILQQTAEYIYQLEQEKARLLSQNSQLKRLLSQHHVSDPEGSPTGTESPNEDRITFSATPPPPPTGPLNTPLPPSVQGHHEDIRRIDAVETTRVYVDKDRNHRLKLEEHIRGLETEVYTTDINMSPEHHMSKMDYQPQEKRLKIEMNEQVKIEMHDDLVPSYTPITELSPVEVEQQSYGKIVREIHLSKPTNKIASSRVSTISTPTNLSKVVNSTPMTTTNGNTSAILNHAIVTVMPPKSDTKTLPSVLNINEMDVTDVPTTITSENINDNISELSNHTVFIVNSSSSPCQKSLDTICEAIRHLEGDHMFPPEDHHQPSRIEEEVVTEETYTVEDNHHHTLGQTGYASDKINGSMSHLTLHMIEPQEVPLELTTSHRDAPQHHHHQYSFTQQSPTTLLKHSSRPGVIVVKHS